MKCLGKIIVYTCLATRNKVFQEIILDVFWKISVKPETGWIVLKNSSNLWNSTLVLVED